MACALRLLKSDGRMQGLKIQRPDWRRFGSLARSEYDSGESRAAGGMKSRIGSVGFAFILTGCATAIPVCPTGLTAMTRAELLFGDERPNGTAVSAVEWQE